MTSTTNNEKLTCLRSTLNDLSSFQLPDHCKRKHDDEAITAADSNAPGSFPNPRLLKRYKSARDTYIHRRTLQLFVEMMDTYNPSTNEFTLPTVSDEERARLLASKQEAIEAIKSTVGKVESMQCEIMEKYEGFERKREELADIVDKMERDPNLLSDSANPSNSANSDNGSNEEKEVIDEHEIQQQQTSLDQLSERKEMLQHKLRLIRGQIAHVESEVSDMQLAVNEVRAKSGRKTIDWQFESTSDGTDRSSGAEMSGVNTVELFNVKEGIDAELAEMRQKITELQNSTLFYEGMRELMEELGGVKILETRHDTTDGGKGGYSITFMLLHHHILEVQLVPSHDKKNLRIQNAKLLTSTKLPVPTVSEEETTTFINTIHSINNSSFVKFATRKPCEGISIHLNDLLSTSQSLESSHGIRFLLSETLSRIRTVQARIIEYSTLKSKYCYQVYDISNDEQEVVCALNEGISIAMRLNIDAPLVKGSVTITELCGVGGWSEEVLQEMKECLGEKRCRGPVEVMECLVEEIGRRRGEEGWKEPLTPVLMRGGGD
ncbi:hypothetical protein ACHAXN_006807 [Cyclotella atomus]